MVERIKNYINGKWVDSKSGETFRSINPANKDEVVGIVAKSRPPVILHADTRISI